MQLGTLCIQFSHLYSATKLLEKASFQLKPQCDVNAVFSPGLCGRVGGGGGGGCRQALGQGGGRNVRDY